MCDIAIGVFARGVIFVLSRHARIKKACQKGFNSGFFKLIRGREDPNTTKNGPLLARKRNAI